MHSYAVLWLRRVSAAGIAALLVIIYRRRTTVRSVSAPATPHLAQATLSWVA
jgi:hypothetical protein